MRGTNVLLREEANGSEALRKRSTTDALTGLHTRGWLDDMLRRLAARAEQGDAPFALLVIDVDHFKTVNDTWGHIVGDRVLQQGAEVLRATVRPTDFAARYGGGDFSVVLPAVSGPQNATRGGDRIWKRVRNTVRLPKGGSGPPCVTVSIGVAGHPRGEAAETLFHRADQLLYRAKNEGRDCIVC